MVSPSLVIRSLHFDTSTFNLLVFFFSGFLRPQNPLQRETTSQPEGWGLLVPHTPPYKYFTLDLSAGLEVDIYYTSCKISLS